MQNHNKKSVVKSVLKSPQSFRQVIKLLNDNSVEYFTYQAKEDKSYRVVLKKLHHTTPIELITQDLEDLGFSVRNVTNIKNKNQHSSPLPLFFIDLNQALNNPEIFKLKTLCHSIVKIEEPHSRRDIPQCYRCQNYGHTRTYCNRSPRCVRCGQAHVSDMCEKTKDTPATCALCGKDHPANYRGCAVHKELQKSRNTIASTSHTNVSKGPYDNNFPDKNEQHSKWEKIKAHAGATIYIKSNITHHSLPPYSTPHIQAASVSLVVPNNIPVTVSAVYCPPDLITTSDHFSDYFSTLGHRFISGGDFNSINPAWGNRSPKTRGRALQQCINNKNYSSFAPPGPTYWPSHNNRLPDILDIFVKKLPSNIHSDLTNLYDLSSDHTPTMLKFGLNISPQQSQSLITSQLNWSTFKKVMNKDNKLSISLKTSDDINDAVNLLITSIQKSALESAKPYNHTNPNKQTPYYIKLLLAEKRRTRIQWQTFKYPNNKVKLNELNSKIKKAILHDRNQSYNNYVESLTTKNSSLWKATKSLLRLNQPTPPLRNEDNSWAPTDIDKANILAQHLENSFSPHDIQPSHTQLKIIEKYIDAPLPMSMPAKPTSSDEINNIIKKIPTKNHPVTT
ncbi:hypothetical protein QTP88_022162 [Uroleucon formosanum]